MKTLLPKFIYFLLLNFLVCTVSSQYKWDQVKFGASGAVPTIKSHPRVPDLYFIATDVGTPYRWNSTFQKWEPLMLFKAFPTEYWGGTNQQCGDIAIDPNDFSGNILYATVQNGRGTAPEKPSSMGTVVKSFDRGETWTDLNLPIIVKPNGTQHLTDRLLVDPNNSNVVWVTTGRNGTYKSNNGGNSWTKVSTGIPDENSYTNNNGQVIYNEATTFLAFDVSQGTLINADGQKITKRIYLGARDGLHVSEDGGISFTLMSGSPDTTRRITLHKDGTLYMTASDALYKLLDNVWYDISPVVKKSYSRVAVNPSNSQEIIVSSTGTWNKDAVYRSRNGGAPGSWVKMNSTKEISEAPHLGKSGIELGNVGFNSFEIVWDQFHSNMVWLVDQSAVYQGTNVWGDPVNWKLRANGLEEIVVTGPLSAPPTGINVLLSSFADIVGGGEHGSLSETPVRTMGASALGANNWGGLNSQDITFQYSNPNFLVRIGSVTWDNLDVVNSRSGYSLDGGGSWKRFPVSPGIRGRAVIPSSGNRIIWITQADGWGKIGHVYYTDDFGASWKLSAGAPAGILPYGDQWFVYPGANYIAADKVDPNLVYIWDRGKFYVSKDGGASFEVSATGLPTAYNNGANNSSYPVITNIATTPGRTGDIWLAHGMPSMAGLYHSSDTGKTWTIIPNIKPRWVATGMSDTSANAHPIVFVTSASNAINGINFGVFRSDDMGATWNTVSERLPGIARNLAADNKGRVFAGINGNGMWYASPVGGEVISVTIENTQPDTTTLGKNIQLKAILNPAYPTNPLVTWSSSDETVAVINANGLLQPVGVGNVTITATADGGKENSKIITIIPVVYADSIAVDSVLYATLNANKMLSAKVYPEMTTDKTLIWTIEDSTIAKLDSNGAIIGLKEGRTNVTVKSINGNAYRTVKLVVNTTFLAINAGTERDGYEYKNKPVGQFIPDGPNGDNNLWKAGSAYPGTPVTRPINLTKIEDPAPMQVYQSHRFSNINITPLRYFFRNLTPNANYSLRLHFVETNTSITAGQRLFSVKSNNSADSLINFDIIKEAGGTDIAITKSMNVIADINGTVSVWFYPVKSSTIINGLELRVIPLQRIAINSSNDTLSVNNSDTLTITTYPVNATNRNVFWKSSDVSVATINDKGVIAGLKEGNVTFTATSAEGNYIATKTFEVQNLPVDSITLTPSEVVLSVGHSVTIAATVHPSNATEKKIVWTSSDNNIAIVDSSGVVKTKAAGNITISATSLDGSRSASSNIVVANILATEIILNPLTENVGVGDTLLMHAAIIPSNATVKKVEWNSSDVSIATIDSNGIVKAMSEGDVTITASTNDGSNIVKSSVLKIVPSGQCGLYENNGFESDFVGWTKTQNPAFIVPNKEVVHSGYKSAAILPNTSKSIFVKQNSVKVVSGSTITLTCWYKIDKSVDQWGNPQWPWNAGCGIFFNNSSNQKVGEGEYTIHDIAGIREGWVQHTFKQVVPAGATTMGLWVGKLGPGTLYIDGFCLLVQVDSVKAEVNNLTINKGEQKQISATIWPENATDKNVTWQSTDPSVATVDSSGTITAVAQGTTSIIITALNGAATPNTNGNIIRASNTGGEGLSASANNGLRLIAASTFSLGTPVSDTINVVVTNGVLPVELVKFDVKKVDNTVQLTWATASEKNNEEFVVYHSGTGKDFKVLLTQKSKSAKGASYVHYDREPMNGINYYKLTQTDIDGNAKELVTKSIIFELGKLSVQLYPNPVKNIAYLDINSLQETTLQVNVYNLSGANVLSKKLNVKKGTNNTSLVLSNLQKGIYFVNIQDTKSEIKEVIKILVN